MPQVCLQAVSEAVLILSHSLIVAELVFVEHLARVPIAHRERAERDGEATRNIEAPLLEEAGAVGGAGDGRAGLACAISRSERCVIAPRNSVRS